MNDIPFLSSRKRFIYVWTCYIIRVSPLFDMTRDITRNYCFNGIICINQSDKRISDFYQKCDCVHSCVHSINHRQSNEKACLAVNSVGLVVVEMVTNSVYLKCRSRWGGFWFCSLEITSWVLWFQDFNRPNNFFRRPKWINPRITTTIS